MTGHCEKQQKKPEWLQHKQNSRFFTMQSPATAAPAAVSGPAHVIVFGNEKGGSGKSTTAMHVAVALLRLGYRVGTIDLDARQATFTRYMKNRFDFIARTRRLIPMPAHMAIQRSQAAAVEEQEREEREFLRLALTELGRECDFIVIDTPGTDSYLSRLGHSHADTLITPLNDSFIDLDLLARIDPDSYQILAPSIYARMVDEQRREKAARGDKKPVEWIVMRNRLSHVDARNKREIGDILEGIGEKAGFRIAPGFGERVIFRELFLKGLTLLDIQEDSSIPLTISQVAARQEVRQLVLAIGPERFKGHRAPADGFA